MTPKKPEDEKPPAEGKTAATGDNGDKVVKSDSPTAVKLHVGNLSYVTTPSDLYDFFSTMYGQDNVLECHIPVEQVTGRSRGFGFVAMPKAIAHQALEPGRRGQWSIADSGHEQLCGNDCSPSGEAPTSGQ